MYLHMADLHDAMLTRHQRFTQIDADILQECRRFETPFFIVRSKSDIHIRNVQEDDELSFEEARNEFVSQTRTSLNDNLRRYNLWDDSNPTESYIVAAQCIYDLMTVEEAAAQQDVKKGGKLRHKYIDEQKLHKALFKTAVERRYAQSSSSTVRWAASAMFGAAASNFGLSLGN